MPEPGDVVVVDFRGATGIKRRPCVLVSSERYHAEHPDLILGVLTTSVGSAHTTSDYLLEDWAHAGLHSPTAFRAYFGMAVPCDVRVIGHLSDRDWDGVRSCVRVALAQT